MSILFKKGGLLTTIQDLGRNKFRKFGVNPNGAMDETAVRLINILLGNDENEAILENYFPSPEILFEESAVFALGGADFEAKLNNESIENWRVYFAEKDSVLSFRQKKTGNRAYLSIKGGFEITEVLGSKSTNLIAGFGGFEGRQLKTGDRILFKRPQNFHTRNSKFRISRSLLPFYSRFPTVRVIAGAEFDNLTAFSEQNFLKTDYIISQNSDRMGFRLHGEPLYLLNTFELLSSAVNFGTIQLLPDGNPIILMADHQTTGGYPRIASVIPNDLPLVAQLGVNDKIAFHLVSLEEAEELIFEFERDINLLKTAVKFQK